MKIKPLRIGDKANFQTLRQAAKNDDLALVSTRRKSDGADVAVVCAMNHVMEDGKVVLIPAPLAVMVEGNPYEDFEDPTKSES